VNEVQGTKHFDTYIFVDVSIIMHWSCNDALCNKNEIACSDPMINKAVAYPSHTVALLAITETEMISLVAG